MPIVNTCCCCFDIVLGATINAEGERGMVSDQEMRADNAGGGIAILPDAPVSFMKCRPRRAYLS